MAQAPQFPVTTCGYCGSHYGTMCASEDKTALYLWRKDNTFVDTFDVATNRVTNSIRVRGEVQGRFFRSELKITGFVGGMVCSGGVLYLTHSDNNGPQNILRLNLQNGEFSVLVGGETHGYRDGAGDQALFFSPQGIAISPNKRLLFVSEYGNNLVRSIRISDKHVSTVAGVGTRRQVGKLEGNAQKVDMRGPTGLLAKSDGTVFVVSYWNHCMALIDLRGQIVRVMVGGRGYKDGNQKEALLKFPRWITEDDEGAIYIWDGGNARIRKITADWSTVTTIGGNGEEKIADGDGVNASFKHASAMVFGKSYIGNKKMLYLIDDGKVRSLTLEEGGDKNQAMGEDSASVWTFHPGLDSDGGDVDMQQLSLPEMKMKCIQLGAVAFNTTGFIKARLKPREQWVTWSQKPTDGLWVREMDVHPVLSKKLDDEDEEKYTEKEDPSLPAGKKIEDFGSQEDHKPKSVAELQAGLATVSLNHEQSLRDRNKSHDTELQRLKTEIRTRIQKHQDWVKEAQKSYNARVLFLQQQISQTEARVKRQAQSQQADWNCSHCTFENDGSNDTCEMCTAPKPLDSVESIKQQLEEVQEQLEESNLCQICIENKRDTILLPCGHFLYCLECAEQLKDCASCREEIKGKQKVFT